MWFVGCCRVGAEPGPSAPDRIGKALGAAAATGSPGERIVALSGQFLGRPYLAKTLVGGPQQEERLVTRTDAFDCFTLLDVVEALRRSTRADAFAEQLALVRYRYGQLSYGSRRHFFSDWVVDDDSPVADVTAEVGAEGSLALVKNLNLKSDGTLWLPGIAVTAREIVYLPASRIDRTTLQKLQPGDYVGIYSELDGLDVSHVGLIVRDGDRLLLRHASSQPGVMRVVDEELMTYLKNKPGLVVYRVKP